MANGEAFQIAGGLKVSNAAIGVGGLVMLGAIGAHLITSVLTGKKQRAETVAVKTSTPSIHEAMFGEAQAMATDPTVVDRNADRVNEALKQRRDYIQILRQKVQNGQIDLSQFTDAIQQHSSDVLDQLGIAQNPHHSAVHPEHVKAHKQFRQHKLMDQFTVPGGMILDPEEKSYVEHLKMKYSYPGETERFAAREAALKQAEQTRLNMLRQRYREQQAHLQAIIQRDIAQDAFVQGIHERKKAGVSQ